MQTNYGESYVILKTVKIIIIALLKHIYKKADSSLGISCEVRSGYALDADDDNELFP